MAFNRMFGKKKEGPPAPSLNDTIATSEARGESIEKKISKLNGQVKKIYEDMKRYPKNSSSYNMKKHQAMRLMKQKKAYENQLMTNMDMVFNMDQTNSMIETVKVNKEMVTAMKGGVTALKKEFKTMNLDAVDDVMDDMADLMDEANEIQEVLSQTYGAPELDDEEFEAELSALDFDAEFDNAGFEDIAEAGDGAIVPTEAEPAQPEAAKEVDDFGLPPLPS